MAQEIEKTIQKTNDILIEILMELRNRNELPVITPGNLREILGLKSFNALAELPIPRCYLKRGGKKYVYLAADVLDYLRGQRDATEIDLAL